MQEIQVIEIPKIEVSQGEVTFTGYTELRAQAIEIAKYLETVDVTEETVKASKKLLAEVNKAVKHLEDERIKVKKTLLEPYNEFETQVKEIVGIVRDADGLVRDQVKELDEKEREKKKAEIVELFEKRTTGTRVGDLFTLDDFLKPQHLNKSVSMNKVENEMADWMASVETALAAIDGMEHADEIIVEYKTTLDLAGSIKAVNDRYEQLKAVEAAKEAEQRAKVEQKEEKFQNYADLSREYHFIIKDEKDAKLTELLLTQNNIKFMKEIY